MRRVAVLFFLFSSLAACSSPLSPSKTALAKPFALSNLRVRQLGLPTDLCGSYFDYSAWDEVTFDFQGASAAEILNAKVFQSSSDNARALVGTVKSCSTTGVPCTGTSVACLVNSSSTDLSGTIRMAAKVGWSPTRAWNISLDTGLARTDVLSASLVRPDALPFGDRAGIWALEVTRSSAFSVSFHFAIYSPQVPGRSIRESIDTFFSDGSTFLSLPTASAELPSTPMMGTFGGLVSRPGTMTYRFKMEELDAQGNVIATEQRTVILP